MIIQESIINSADNSGAKKLKCIRILGNSRCGYASIGDIISCSVRVAVPGSQIKKGDIVRAVIVRTRKEIRRKDGSYIRFSENAAVIVNKDKEPVGTRVFGPIARELRERNFIRIMSLAPEVL